MQPGDALTILAGPHAQLVGSLSGIAWMSSTRRAPKAQRSLSEVPASDGGASRRR
jgi:hypothetical protein